MSTEPPLIPGEKLQSEPPIVRVAPAKYPVAIYYFVVAFFWFVLLIRLVYPRLLNEFTYFESANAPVKSCFQLGTTMLWGFDLAACYYIYRWFRKGATRFPTLAGHWLCLVYPLIRITPIIERRFITKYFVQAGKTYRDFNAFDIALSVIFVPLSVALIWLGLALIKQLPRYWRWFYLLMALTLFIYAVESLRIYFLIKDFKAGQRINFDPEVWRHKIIAMYHYGPPLICGLFIVFDIRNRTQLDWLHWVGVGSVLAVLAAKVVLWWATDSYWFYYDESLF